MPRMQLLVKKQNENNNHGNQGRDALCRGCNFSLTKVVTNKHHGNQCRDVLCRGCYFWLQKEMETKITGTRVGMFYAADATFVLKQRENTNNVNQGRDVLCRGCNLFFKQAVKTQIRRPNGLEACGSKGFGLKL